VAQNRNHKLPDRLDTRYRRRNTGGRGAINIVNPNPPFQADERGPSWTQRHDQIAYYTAGGAAAGGTARKATSSNLADTSPDYRADGRWIVYSGWDGNDFEIYEVHTPNPITGFIFPPPTHLQQYGRLRSGTVQWGKGWRLLLTPAEE
jgi:hypothetical protein